MSVSILEFEGVIGIELKRLAGRNIDHCAKCLICKYNRAFPNAKVDCKDIVCRYNYNAMAPGMPGYNHMYSIGYTFILYKAENKGLLEVGQAVLAVISMKNMHQ